MSSLKRHERALDAQVKTIIDNWKTLPQELKKDVRQEIWATGKIVESKAKRNAPVNEGLLRSQITGEMALFQSGAIRYKVISNAHYSAYVEYGRPPGSMPPVDAIEFWVRRQKKLLGAGATEAHIKSLAWAIAKKIKEHGTEAQPFFVDAYESERDQFMKRMRNVVKRHTK